MTRHTRFFFCLAGLLGLVAAMVSPVAAHGTPANPPASAGAPPSKVAARVVQMAARLAARAAEGGEPNASGPPPPPSSLSNSLVHVDDDGRIELAFHAAAFAGPDEEADLVRLGTTGIRSRPAGSPSTGSGRLQGWLPYDQLDAAAALTWVTAIEPPAYARLNAGPSGDVVSQGVDIHMANLLHAKGIDGTGITVGVVSDGVTSLAEAQTAGELPAGVTVVGAAGTGDEGTAMLEIVHDMAPGASLLFAPVGEDADSFVNAMKSLVTAGANVIAHDVAFDTEPVFEEGFVAQSLDDIAKGGVAVYAAAGNTGFTHTRVPAVGTGKGPDGRAGPFANCAKQPTNTVALAPNNDTTFDVQAFGPPAPKGTYVLQWSEPSSGISGHGGFTNLDLYVMDENLTTCIAESDDVQANGAGDTLEALVGRPPADAKLKIVVNVAGTSSAVAPPTLDLRFRDALPLDVPTLAGSINPNNNFTSGLPAAVGAVDAATGKLEAFSGEGPVQLFSTTTCPDNGPGPCVGVAGAPPRTFQGPAFVAADNVLVSGAGGFPDPNVTGPQLFRGTSAAAPHAAGCDALVRQAVGSAAATVANIRERLSASAHDIAPAGPDTASGSGLLDCLAATRSSNLTVSMSSAPDKVAVGDKVTYTISVKNDGPDDAIEFTLIDTLPIGVTYASGPAECVAGPVVAGSAQVVTCKEASLANGQVRTLALVATVGSLPDGTTTLENQAVVQSAFDLTVDQNNTAKASTAVEVATDAGAPIVGEPLARTGDEQRHLFDFGLGILLVGVLFVLGASSPSPSRRAAISRADRARRGAAGSRR